MFSLHPNSYLAFFVRQTLVCSPENQYTMSSRAKVLSRRVWDLLMAVPTNPSILSSLSDLDAEATRTWKSLLDPEKPSKIVYSLQVIFCSVVDHVIWL